MTTRKGKIKTRFSDMEPSGQRTEFVCEHGVGHHMGVHGCDGCCANEPLMEKTTRDTPPSTHDTTGVTTGVYDMTKFEPIIRPKEPVANWEEGFTKRFGRSSILKLGDDRNYYDITGVLLDFIRSIESAAISGEREKAKENSEQLIERCIEMHKEGLKDGAKEERGRITKLLEGLKKENYYNDYEEGYSEAIVVAISHITTIEK